MWFCFCLYISSEWLHATLHGGSGESLGGRAIPLGKWRKSKHCNRGMFIFHIVIYIQLLKVKTICNILPIFFSFLYEACNHLTFFPLCSSRMALLHLLLLFSRGTTQLSPCCWSMTLRVRYAFQPCTLLPAKTTQSLLHCCFRMTTTLMSSLRWGRATGTSYILLFVGSLGNNNKTDRPGLSENAVLYRSLFFIFKLCKLINILSVLN